MSGPLEDKEPDSAGTSLIDIQILDGGFAAALFVSEDSETFPSLKQVHLAIENAGVIHGIDDGVVEKLIEEKIRGKPVVFAKGKSPKAGSSSRLIWHGNSPAGASPLDVTEALSNPGRDLSLFMAVEKGQQILSKLAATEGEGGTNVFGQSITLPGADIPVPGGDGTALSKDGLTLLASKSGIATWLGDRISVTDVHHVDGSVDFGTGNLKIEGSVHIEKDVRSGFRVEAIGDIYIGGNIEGAEVYSRGGSVVVRNGIIGQGRARVLAGRDIVAGFIQDATIGAKLDVEVKRYVLNSAVTAGRYIRAVTNKGTVRGGILFAEKRIDVRTAGSESRIATELKVGYTPPMNLSRARYQLRHDQRRNRMELAYVQKRLAFLKLLKERMGQLKDDKEVQLAELERKESFLLSRYRQQSTKEAQLIKQAKAPEEEKPEAETIRVHDTIYPNVSVAIGDVNLEMDKERHNVLFFRAGDRLAFGPLRQALEKKS
ncbi:MAG: DUF342 domain-containing protein [Candidatus Neomarinimicrobiota bacterium]